MSSSRGRKLKPKSISPTMVTPSKKRRPSTPAVAAAPAAPVTVKIEPVEEITPTASREDSPAPSECMDKIPVFKNKNFVHSCVGNSGTKKTRVWKNLKQIIATEKTQPWRPDDVTSKKYSELSAKIKPADLSGLAVSIGSKPAKKYTDLSGLALRNTPDLSRLTVVLVKPAKKYSDLSGLAVVLIKPKLRKSKLRISQD
ncbi:IES6 [Mytilus edulis]|uniref:INO80C n=1 Tax=Mytilus edulis TaxID=6550 RepID=A0A8S3TAN3_MYTED|nr:IES6 [Mytilus edulis]